MIISDISVKRPVFASVLSILLIAFGFVSYEKLTLREYPNIDPPIVTVEVTYPGAPSNIVETRITQLVEDRITGIEGIEFISSSSRDGKSTVTIQFSINRDIDGAANDVRDRISGIADNLPEEADPPEVQKADSNDDVIIWQNLTSDNMSVPELTDYARRYLVDQYSTLDGVARVRIGGQQNYALRIWLDRQEMAARNISISEVESALRSENLELPAGSLESKNQMFQARVARHFEKPGDFQNLVIKQGDDGYIIRLGDVAKVELSVEEERTFFRGNQIPMVGIGVIRQSTANTIDVAKATIDLTNKLNKNLPNGMSIEQSYNAAVFIEASINEVYTTLMIAIGCVILVIYLFLGSFQAMLIPAVVVPISLIATFIAMYAFGFSVNLLTLLAFVLAIGLVVDDAIVMLENIVRRIQHYYEPPLLAAYRGAREVGFAVIATTLVLIAVFVPITFLEGDIGRLFTEFALTIVAAVCFSSLIALTLSPMLASKLLKAKTKETQPRGLTRIVDSVVNALRDVYLRALNFVMRHKAFCFIFYVAIVAGGVMLYPKIAQEFTPYEDRGVFFVFVKGQEGATYTYMEDYLNEIESRLMKYVDNKEVNRLLVRAPLGLGNISNFNGGIVIAVMNDWAKRRPAKEVMNEVRQSLSDLPGVRAFPVMRQGLGGGTGKPVQFVLGGASYDELAKWSEILIAKINENNPGLQGIDTDYKDTRPQIDIKVDYDRSAALGVNIEEIGRTLETMMGGRRVTTFLDNGEEYDVIVEGIREDQRSFADINSIYVRSDRTQELIPLSNLVQISEYGAAETLSRYNRVRAITIEANLDEGYRLGDALAYLEDLAKEHLPSEAIIDYKGQSRDFVESGSSVIFVFLLGILIVFLVLAAQFESFVHPFIIMLTVPLTLAGGLLALFVTNTSFNIYSQIGLIMLVGLAAKNGILIVEFTNQLRDQGYAFKDAILQSAHTRFRPVLMTGLTTIAGSIPLVLASGAGSETRVVIGIVILGGVLTATIFTLFVVPLAYDLLAKGTGSPSDVAKKLEEQDRDYGNEELG